MQSQSCSHYPEFKSFIQMCYPNSKSVIPIANYNANLEAQYLILILNCQSIVWFLTQNCKPISESQAWINILKTNCEIPNHNPKSQFKITIQIPTCSSANTVWQIWNWKINKTKRKEKISISEVYRKFCWLLIKLSKALQLP